jgi:hypothetical protein
MRLGLSWPPLLISVLAFLVSLGSLWLGITEWTDQRQFIRLQSQPSLTVDAGKNATEFYLSLFNDGPGVARLKYFYLTIDGKRMNDWGAVATALGADSHSTGFHFSDPLPGAVFAAGGVEKKQDLLRITDRNFSAIADSFAARANVVFCYCSIFDDCWIWGIRQKTAQATSTPCPLDLDGGMRPPADFWTGKS